MVDAAGLLLRPVAADNAAMEAEPTKAEPPLWRRRISAMLFGIGIAGLATTIDDAVWLIVGQPVMDSPRSN